MAKNKAKYGKQKTQVDQPEKELGGGERLKGNLQRAPMAQQANDRKAALMASPPEAGSPPPRQGPEVEIKDDDSTKSYNNNNNKVGTGNVILFSNLEVEDEQQSKSSGGHALSEGFEPKDGESRSPSRSKSRGGGAHNDEKLTEAESKSKQKQEAKSKDAEENAKGTTKQEQKTLDEPNARKDSVKNTDELSPEDLAIERMLLEEEQRQKMLDALAPEELVDKTLGEGQEAGGWRRRKVRQKGLPAKAADESSDANSDMPGQQKETVEKRPTKDNKQTQEKLRLLGDRIPVVTESNVKFAQHESYFKYMIYDGYRPLNLAHARDYIDFLVRPLRDNAGDELQPEYTPQHILDYLGQDIKTKLPGYVDEDKILTFDQNFECGNLDSAYLHGAHEYNLVMKVDTNTRGNTYWFMFKVSDFVVGQKYKFNIMNFSRNMDKFYNCGMGPVTRREKKSSSASSSEASDRGAADHENQHKDDGADEASAGDEKGSKGGQEVNDKSNRRGEDANVDAKESKSSNSSSTTGEWRQQTCTNLEYYQQSDLVRSTRRHYETGEILSQCYFSKLSFSYTFTEEDRGHTVAIASAIPYGYTDMLDDIDAAKQHILQSKDHGEVFYRLLDKEDLLESNAAQKLQARLAKDAKKQMTDTQPGKKEKPKQAPPAKVGFGSVLKEEKSSAQKVNLYEIQHMAIKREGIERIRNNRFEDQFAEADQNNEIKNEFQHASGIRNSIPDRDENFEIQNKLIHYRQEVIGQSMCGLNIYQLTLTKKREHSMKHKKKQVIYIQARLHAAETHGSLIMRNILLELTANYQKYDAILSSYIIKLVPMLNPDGVVIGNSRSSLSGVDLNRRWSSPNSIMHPEVYFMKIQMALTAKQSAGICLFCDLHGHNKQMNTFIYGCNKAPNQGLLSWTKTRLFPKIFASIEPIFNFSMCQFSQEKAKYNTARVVVWNEFKVTNSFTLETSMYGKRERNALKRRKMKEVTTQFVLNDFRSIGLSLIQTIRNYISLEKELEEEFKATGGWLRKKKLDEVTGETARQKAEQSNILQIQKLHDRGPNPTTKHTNKPRARRSQSNAAAVVGLQALAPEKSDEKEEAQVVSSQVDPNPSEPVAAEAGSAGAPNQKAVGEKLESKLLKKSLTTLNGLKKSKDGPLKSSLDVVQEDSNHHDSRSSLENEDEEKRQAQEITEEKDGGQQQDEKENYPKLENQKDPQDQSNPNPDVEKGANWKEFFSKDEIENAVIESKKPIKKDIKGNKITKSQANAKFMKEQAESDSEPSCDNFDEEELAEIFEVAVSDDEMDTLKPSANKKKKEPEMRPAYNLQRGAPQNRGDKQQASMRPREYNSIVERIQGVQKETEKLGKRFTLLTQQIHAKILQDQSQYSTGNYPPNHLITLNDRRMQGPQIGGVPVGSILGLGQSSSKKLLDADFGSAGPKSGQRFASGAQNFDQQRNQQENLKFATFAPLLRNLLDQNSNQLDVQKQMLSKFKSPESKGSNDLNLAYAAAPKYPGQALSHAQQTNLAVFQNVVPHINGVSGAQGDALQKFIENLTEQDKRNKNQGPSPMREDEGLRGPLSRKESTYTQDSNVFEDVQHANYHVAAHPPKHIHQPNIGGPGDNHAINQNPPKTLTQSMNKIATHTKQWSTTKKEHSKGMLVEAQLSQNASQMIQTPNKEGFGNQLSLKKELTTQNQRFVGQRAQRGTARLPPHPRNDSLKRQFHEQPPQSRGPPLSSSFNASDRKAIHHQPPSQIEIPVANSYVGSHNYPSSYSIDGGEGHTSFHYPKGSGGGIQVPRKSIGSQQESNRMDKTPRGSQLLQLNAIPGVKSQSKKRYAEDASGNYATNYEQGHRGMSNKHASPMNMHENYNTIAPYPSLPSSLTISQQYAASPMTNRKADAHTKLPVLKPNQVKVGSAAASLDQSWNGLSKSQTRKTSNNQLHQ